MESHEESVSEDRIANAESVNEIRKLDRDANGLLETRTESS